VDSQPREEKRKKLQSSLDLEGTDLLASLGKLTAYRTRRVLGQRKVMEGDPIGKISHKE